ncbi:hypothetical protein NUW54_g9028 [Trametes sanguinea]|uniref:Uncharacterized protein n=1 Tax=Trametes sanguinea TaxID=158606 RepID=A0ACC1P935_9APHY|nr:hypothetical protein NUW54_g9028 [Trametes sanguinea]
MSSVLSDSSGEAVAATCTLCPSTRACDQLGSVVTTARCRATPTVTQMQDGKAMKLGVQMHTPECGQVSRTSILAKATSVGNVSAYERHARYFRIPPEEEADSAVRAVDAAQQTEHDGAGRIVRFHDGHEGSVVVLTIALPVWVYSGNFSAPGALPDPVRELVDGDGR